MAGSSQSAPHGVFEGVVINAGSSPVETALVVTGGASIDSITNTGAFAATGASTLSGSVNYKRQVTDTGGVFATPIVLTEAMSGRVLLGDDAAGLDFTLPAIAAAQIGLFYEFISIVAPTSNSYRFTAQAADLLTGGLWMPDFNAAVDAATREAIYFSPDVTDDLILTMNGTTTGGKIGTHIKVLAISATRWFVSGIAAGDGTIITPFS